MDNTKAPERIWMWPDDTFQPEALSNWHVVDQDTFGGTPYIREDIHKAQIAAVLEKAAEEASCAIDPIDAYYHVLDLTPDDAKAALEAAVQEAEQRGYAHAEDADDEQIQMMIQEAVAKERERCAKIADREAAYCEQREGHDTGETDGWLWAKQTALDVAAAIRSTDE